jgi:hypothetical protein
MTAETIAFSPASTFIGREAVAYGTTAASMLRSFPTQSWKATLTQTPLENQDERVNIFERAKSVQGLKSWQCALSFLIKPHVAQLDASTSPTTDYEWDTLLRSGFGAISSAQGSTVASSTSSSVTVAAAHGSRFKIGSWIGVEVGVSGGSLEYRRVTNISTDTLTVYPNFTGTPFATGKVINSKTLIPTQTNSNSLTIQAAKAQSSTNQRYTLNGGCVTALALKIARDSLAMVDATIAGSLWTFPGGDSVAVTTAADTLATPVHPRNAITLLQANATTTATHYPIHSQEYTVNVGNILVNETGGATEGVIGVQRTGARPFAMAKISARADNQLQTWYEAQTALGFQVIMVSGTGLTQRAVVIDIPTCYISPMIEHGDES